MIRRIVKEIIMKSENYNKLISVIIPIYNSKTTIVRAINSILKNKLNINEYEVIIVDDGSNDNVYGYVLDLFSKENNIKIYRKNNGGVSSARNYGLQRAEGRYIMFCDSDDEYQEGLLDCIKNIVDNMDYDYITFNRVDYKNNILVCEYLDKLLPGQVFLDNIEFIKKYFANGKITYSVCNKVFKRSIIDLNGLTFDETTKYSEDTVFNLNYLLFSETFYITNEKKYIRNCEEGSAIYKQVKDFYSKNMYPINNFFKKFDNPDIYNIINLHYSEVSIDRNLLNLNNLNLKEKHHEIKFIKDTLFIYGKKLEYNFYPFKNMLYFLINKNFIYLAIMLSFYMRKAKNIIYKLYKGK